MKQSAKRSLNKADWQAWTRSALVWLAPLGVIYFGFVAMNLANGFSVEAFIPTNAVLGALALYIVNQLFGLSRRWAAGK